jgi:hypothetical protein
MMHTPFVFRRHLLVGISAAALLAWMPPTQSRVVKIVIDSTTTLTGQNIPYEQLRGRAFGELDPNDSHNQIITDIQLGKDPDGKVRYEATFVITKPVDLTQASGFMWHDVPNRGGAPRSAGREGFAALRICRSRTNCANTMIMRRRSSVNNANNHLRHATVTSTVDAQP